MAGKDAMSTAPGTTDGFTPPSARIEVDLNELERHVDELESFDRDSISVSLTYARELFRLARLGQSHEARLIEQERDVLLAVAKRARETLLRAIGADHGLPDYENALVDEIDDACARAEGTASERTDSAGEKRSSTP